MSVNSLGAIRVDQLTTVELRAILGDESRRTGALLPIGSTEQHGPLLPLGCDTAIARGAAERLATALSSSLDYRALVLPDVPYAPCPGAEDTLGTVSVSFDWLGRGLEEVLRGVFRTPWRFVVLVNAHGHNHGRVIEASIAGAGGRLGRRVPVVVLQVYELAHLADEFGLLPGSHAGEFEIALLKHYVGFEPATRASSAASGRPRPDRIYGLEVMARSRAGVISPEPPRIARSLDQAAALGAAVDQELGRQLLENLDIYFESWHANDSAGKSQPEVGS